MLAGTRRSREWEALGEGKGQGTAKSRSVLGVEESLGFRQELGVAGLCAMCAESALRPTREGLAQCTDVGVVQGTTDHLHR